MILEIRYLIQRKQKQLQYIITDCSENGELIFSMVILSALSTLQSCL